jgi:hypothetical protein
LFGLEAGQRLFLVRAGSQDSYSRFVKLRFCVAKLGRFDRSTGCVGFGKEKEEDTLALEILERDEFLFIGFQNEAGSLGAYLKHESTSVSLSMYWTRAKRKSTKMAA